MKLPQLPFSNSFWKKVLIALLFIIVLIIGVNIFLKYKVENQIQKAGAQFSKFEYQDLSVGFLSGKIYLSELILDWKTDSISGNSNLEKNLGLTAKSASLDGLSWWNLIFKNKINIDELKIDQPNISLFQNNKNEEIFNELLFKQDSTKTDKENFIFNVQSILILNGKVEGFIDSMRWIELDSLNFELEGFTLNKTSKKSPWMVNDFAWEIHNLYYKMPDGLYALRIKEAAGNKIDKSLDVNNIQLHPLVSKMDFRNHVKYKKARLDIAIPAITSQSFQWDSLLFSRKFMAGKLEIDDLKFNAFDDLNIPWCPDCYKPFPQEVLLKASLPISVDSVIVNNGFVKYEHLAPDRTNPGHLTFENINATIINVTNMPQKIAEKPTITLFAQTDFMGISRFNLTTDFHLTDGLYRFTYQAHLQEFDMTNINQMVVDVLRVKVEKGLIKKLAFEGEGNNEEGSGTMDFQYIDLDVALLTEEEKDKKKLLSGIVNGVLIRDNNPTKNNFREGKMYAERVDNRAIFHLWWHSIFSGLKSTMLPKLFLDDKLDPKEGKKRKKRRNRKSEN